MILVHNKIGREVDQENHKITIRMFHFPLWKLSKFAFKASISASAVEHWDVSLYVVENKESKIEQTCYSHFEFCRIILMQKIVLFFKRWLSQHQKCNKSPQCNSQNFNLWEYANSAYCIGLNRAYLIQRKIHEKRQDEKILDENICSAQVFIWITHYKYEICWTFGPSWCIVASKRNTFRRAHPRWSDFRFYDLHLQCVHVTSWFSNPKLKNH